VLSAGSVPQALMVVAQNIDANKLNFIQMTCTLASYWCTQISVQPSIMVAAPTSMSFRASWGRGPTLRAISRSENRRRPSNDDYRELRPSNAYFDNKK
jgi:hypothetical protein